MFKILKKFVATFAFIVLISLGFSLNSEIVKAGSQDFMYFNGSGLEPTIPLLDFGTPTNPWGNIYGTIAGSGDMLKVNYDPANVNEQLVGATAIQTVQNKDIDETNTVLLGTPPDGSYTGGIIPLVNTDQTNFAIDEFNELFTDLAPADALVLGGDIQYTFTEYSGKLSTSSLFFDNLSPGDSVTTIMTDSSFTALSPAQTTTHNDADLGTLVITLNSNPIDTFNYGTAFVEGERTGNQSYPPANAPNDYLTITSVGKYNDFRKWQKANFSVNFGAIYGNADLTGGENGIQVYHDTGSVINSTSIKTLFYDPETFRPSVNGSPTIIEDTPVIKELSGVNYYTTNSTFDIDAQIDHLFQYTYIQTPITLALTGMASVIMDITDGSISGVSTPPVWNETTTITNKSVTLDTANLTSNDARVNVTPADPQGDGSAQQSGSENRLINTYATTSTTLTESFVDENRRLPAGAYDSVPGAITGSWTSGDDLVDGNSQVYNDSLVFPANDFSAGYLPAQDAGSDYSAFAGDQLYYRAYYDSVNPHSSGTLEIDGITQADLGGDIELELKLPTQTGWLDLGTLFNAGTFTGVDGDGSATSYSQGGTVLTINWTAGTFSTADSGDMYILKITHANTNEEINSADETGW